MYFGDAFEPAFNLTLFNQKSIFFFSLMNEELMLAHLIQLKENQGLGFWLSWGGFSH